MTILDSNIWIAFFVEYDSNHQKSKSIIKKLNGNNIFITEYIILEVSTVILNKVNREKASDFLEYILNHNQVDLLQDDKIFIQTAQKFKEQLGNLSFVDTSLLCLSKKYQIISFDKKLNNQIKKIN